MCMAESPGTKSGRRLEVLYCERPQTFREHLPTVLSLRNGKREERHARKGELHRLHRSVLFVELHNTGDAAIRTEAQANGGIWHDRIEDLFEATQKLLPHSLWPG
jgi:hypothetical protein